MNIGLLTWCGLFAAFSALGTWGARAYAVRRRLLDAPGERRSHQVATPRGGGLGIVFALMLACAALLIRMPLMVVVLAAGGLGLLLVAAVGAWDDHRPLSPWLRLAVHALAAGLLATGMVLAGGSATLALSAFVLALVLTNVWNFMDGIDALAASQAALVAVALALVGGGPLGLLLGLALAGACLGFLPFNWPRASVFLGDVGSGALGFALAWLAALTLDGLPQTQWPLVLLPLSAFLVDAGLTLAVRILRRERWWTPHVQHAYQCAARRLGRHGPVAAGYAVWTAIGGIMLLRFRGESIFGGPMLISIWFAIAAGLWFALRRGDPAGRRPLQEVA